MSGEPASPAEEAAALAAFARVEGALVAVGIYHTVDFDDPALHQILTDMGGWPAAGLKLSAGSARLRRAAVRHAEAERARIAEGRPVPDVVYVIGPTGEVIGTRRHGEPRSVLRPVPGQG